jgi:hypothetical protein
LWHFGQHSVHRLSFHGASWSYSDTAHAAGLLRTRDQTLRPLPDNTLLSQETHIPAVGGILNPQSKQDKGRSPIPQTARTQKSDSQSYAHYIWLFTEHSIYWSNIVKHRIVKTN